MRTAEEDPTVIANIAHTTGIPAETVIGVVGALRETIDYLFFDGYSIIAPPFFLVYEDDPVVALLEEKIDKVTEAQLEALQTGDSPEIARLLGIDESEYLDHPIAAEATVLVHLLERLKVKIEGERATIHKIAGAWFDTFTTGRVYRFSKVGLERELEDWLVARPEALESLGFNVRLRHQQLILPDRRRLDLVFDLVQPNGTSGTLIVELKAVHGSKDAVDQLVGYMDAFEELGLSDGPLGGLLIADGFSPDQISYARASGISVATLSGIGYRDP